MKKLVIYFFIGVVIVSCKEEKRYHDKITPITTEAKNDFESQVYAFQEEMNEEYANPKTSPLYDRHRKDFEGLDFFKPNEKFKVEAILEVTPNTAVFLMPTTTEKKNEERVYGILKFKIDGRPFQLEVYQSARLMEQEEYKDYLFLPFTDLTNSETTYGGGRYIDLRIPDSNKIIVDFNKAYNPYCAYNKKYSCPIVPSVNHLDIAVEAGVKAWNKK